MTSRLHIYTIKRNLRIVGNVVLLLILIGLVSLLVVRTFTIRDVVVDAPGMAIHLDAPRFGKNLLFLPTDTFRQELLSSYPLLADVRFEKKLPGTLIVHLVRRLTFALLQSAGNVYAVDEHGLVLDSVNSASGYTILSFEIGVLAIGSRVSDGRTASALSFLRGLDSPTMVSNIEERDSTSLRAKMGNTNIFLPQTGDLSAKATTLQIIVEGFRIKATLPAVIDLRYEKPVITN